MSDDYDFQIGDLKFRAAVSDKFPYARFTAPFRKEQFDASQKVGDQSLTGWWTRGQLSFHKGAGVKYYEVLDGEDVLDRCDDSLGVDLFTPGETTLRVAPESWLNDTHVIGEALTWVGGVDRTAFFIESDTLYSGEFGQVPVVSATTDGTTVSVACAGERACYAGTAGNKIEKHAVSPASVTALYTHTTGFHGIFLGKDRLWILDDQGALYAVSTNPSGTLPVALGSGDLVVTFESPIFPMSFTASEGDVYLCPNGGSTIYRVGLDADGSVATLAAPIVAATLPDGEAVRCLMSYLGVIVIGTAYGFRVAQIGNDGSLVYGPLHPTGDVGESMAIDGTSVYFVSGVTLQEFFGTTYLFEVDLAQPLGDGTYAYARRVALPRQSGHTGAVRLQDYVAMYAGPAFFVGGGAGAIDVMRDGVPDRPLTPEGSVTTGFHRFGTLDLKHFSKVVVRSAGSGTIEAFRVDADGTETSLGTLDASELEGEFDLQLTAPKERIALKFVLARDATAPGDGPTLLGYQLKALPVPERQRLLRWPLVIADVIRLRGGTSAGKKGRAYEALTELETLESTQAVVPFTDHRTGETGSAYIDQVEFQGDTASNRSGGNFGGVCYVTLRVLP